MQRVPPHSIEAESAVLGSLLLDNGAWYTLTDVLNADDFYGKEHRAIFNAIDTLVTGSRQADVITVYELLRARGSGLPVDLAYLNALAQYVPSPVNILRYAQIVRERSTLRRYVSSSSELDVLYETKADASEDSRVSVVSESRWAALLCVLSQRPRLIHELDPRAFEELVAELLSREGLRVTLTPKTRDGGRDILAFSDSVLGRHLYYVECKRYAPDRPVGVALVRQLYGVIEAGRATGGVLVTTSSFTSGAAAFRDTVSARLSLKAYADVSAWISKHSV